MTKPKVLVVEDVTEVQDAFRLILEDKVEYLAALDHRQAIELFSKNPDVNMIVLDGSLCNKSFDTGSLALMFRETFAGPMIAASGDEKFCSELVRLGCNFSVKGQKPHVPKMVISILHEMGRI